MSSLNIITTIIHAGTNTLAILWGTITGTLPNQTDLQAALDLKAPLASPTLTGVPISTTPTAGDNTTKIATTAFVATAIGSPLFAYVAKSGTYAILTTDYTVECTSGTFTVTLPTAVGVSGKVYNIKNSGTGAITVATTSAQTIDGNATESLIQYNCMTVQSNGSNWIII